MKARACKAIALSYKVGFYDALQFLGHITTDNDYSCYVKAVELLNQSYGAHITPLVINSLVRGRYTHIAGKINF